MFQIAYSDRWQFEKKCPLRIGHFIKMFAQSFESTNTRCVRNHVILFDYVSALQTLR